MQMQNRATSISLFKYIVLGGDFNISFGLIFHIEGDLPVIKKVCCIINPDKRKTKFLQYSVNQKSKRKTLHI